MTISMTTGPTVAIVAPDTGATAGADHPTAPVAFATLVAGLLGDLDECAPGGATAAPALDVPGAEEDEPSAPAEPGTPWTEGQTTDLGVLVAGLVGWPATLVPLPVVAPLQGAAPGAAVAAASLALPDPGSVSVSPDPPGSQDAVGQAADQALEGTGSVGGSDAALALPAEAGSPGADPGGPGGDRGQALVAASAQSAPALAGPPGDPLTAMGGTVPATGATASTPPAPAAPPRSSPVSQVVPEVTRLVSRGNGVHQLTMKLQPEALGEVRVTLTVRDGAVQVRLTGGDDAARALAEGAPELRRALELAGAGEARVVVRDAAGQTTGSQSGHARPHEGPADSSYAAQGGAGGDTPASHRGRGEPEQHDQHDQHARTRGGAGARDGLTHGATSLRPDPVGGAPRGIDLTI